jgi:hypothetical protein
MTLPSFIALLDGKWGRIKGVRLAFEISDLPLPIGDEFRIRA